MKNTLLPKLTRWLIEKFFRIEIMGKYQGGQAHGHEKTLIIANHTSFLDGVLLALFLPDNPVFVVNTEIAANSFFKFFLRYVDHLSVDPSHPMAMKKVIHLLQSGRTVAIFPEGRISNTGSLMKVYAGAAFAATRTRATIIPVHISGGRFSYFSRVTHLFKPKIFPKLRLNILAPTTITIRDDLPVRDRRNDAKEQMQHIMMNMMVKARPHLTLYQQLLQAKNEFGKQTLAYEDGLTENLTYQQLVNKSYALSIILGKQNFSRRIGLMLPNSNTTILTFYALQRLNKIPAMINFTAGARAVRAGLEACQADTIITSRTFIEKAQLNELIKELKDYNILYLEDLRDTVTLTDKISIVIKRNFPQWGMPQQSPDDEAVVLFTSGSEGLPKGVVHSHTSLLTNVEQARATYDVKPSDKFMIALPMFHVFGLTIGVLVPMISGASAFLYPNPLHYRTIPEVIYDRNCTVLLSTSTFLNGYARFADPYDFSNIRYIIAGAEKLSDEVIDTYHNKFGIRIMEGYGTTETAPVIAANSGMAYQRGTVGKLFPDIQTKLLPVPGINKGGKLVIRADNVMLGYLKADNPGILEPSPIVNGKREYDTGDIVEIDEKGFLHIKGRAKRFAKIAGEMVSLDTVEKLAKTSSPDHHHAVIQIPDSKKGEVLILFTTDASLQRKQLQQTAKTMGLPELAIPRDIRLLKEIPVFSSGKTNYPALSELL